jgi:hypothetical protein
LAIRAKLRLRRARILAAKILILREKGFSASGKRVLLCDSAQPVPEN